MIYYTRQEWFCKSFTIESLYEHLCLVCWNGNLGGGRVFSHECTPGRTKTHTSSFFPYQQVSGRNGDYE